MSRYPRTPGPWEVSGLWPVNGVPMPVIRSTCAGKMGVGYAIDQDAQLIAAAPTMLDALETVLFGLTADADNNNGEIDRYALIGTVREALRKAGVAE